MGGLVFLVGMSTRKKQWMRKTFIAIDTKHGTECLSCVDDTFMEVE
jgi:hypothetical protein